MTQNGKLPDAIESPSNLALSVFKLVKLAVDVTRSKSSLRMVAVLSMDWNLFLGEYHGALR